MTHHIGAITYRISDDKARARDTFLPRYFATDTPCKAEPDRWHSESLAVRNQAERDCRPCPLLDLCNAWASADPPEQYGVWGGRDRAKKVKKGNK